MTTENLIQLPTTTNLRHKSWPPKKTIKDPLFEFLTNKKNPERCSEAAGTYPQKKISIFSTIKIQDPPTFCFK
jgi:hypothetical protein